MARKKSSMVMNASLEVETGGPLDSREVVDSLTDLTDAASFPYFYEGIHVYVKSEKKTYELVGDDTTAIENWKEIGGAVDSYTKAETDALVEGEHVELTQAQYDALTYEEKHNGKVYFITDGGDYVPAIDIIPNGTQEPIIVGKFDLRGDGEYRNVYRIRRWISDIKNASPIIEAGWQKQGVYIRPLRVQGAFTYHDYKDGIGPIIYQLPIPYVNFTDMNGVTIGMQFYVNYNNDLIMVAQGKSSFNQDDFAQVIIDYIETPIT